MKRHKPQPQNGFSIIEILIAVIIIGILALILVPVLSTRAEDARKASVTSDLQSIAAAQEQLAIELGYYVRLYALDDQKGGNGQPLGTTSMYDGILDEPLNSALYLNPGQIFINPESNQLLSVVASQNVLDQIDAGTLTWNGPYFNIHRDETIDENDRLSDPPHLHDIPNDPWGNDYILILREGVLIEPDGVIEPVIAPGQLGATSSFDVETRYDRPAIMSLGPDGAFGTSDDFVRSFGY